MNQLWWLQIKAIIRIELRKTFFARRGLWIYLLALAPVALFTIQSVVSRGGVSFEQETYVFAGVFQFFYIRLAVFFGCLGIFMNLIRGEMLDRTLHFYLLAPVRREVMLVGKYLAGLLASVVIFTGGTALQLIAISFGFGANTLSHFLYQENGFAQVAAYLGVAALACVGYGSVFLAAGLLFRNPIIPAAAVLIWEAVNPLLPALLKKVSVIYYLQSLCPVQVPIDPGMPKLFVLLVSNAEPASPTLAVLSLVALSGAVLYAASVRARTLEINYTTE